MNSATASRVLSLDEAAAYRPQQVVEYLFKLRDDLRTLLHPHARGDEPYHELSVVQ